MIRLDFAQLFAPCLLLLPSFLGHLFEMTANIPTRPLLTMLDAFPEGLPAPPIDMPDWSSMDYNQYAAFFQLKELGTFAIPLANVHVHQGQRPEDNHWVGILQVKFVDDGIQANAPPLRRYSKHCRYTPWCQWKTWSIPNAHICHFWSSSLHCTLEDG